MGLTVTPPVSLGTGVAAFLATPSSANLATAVTDETGTAGSVVFSTSPAFTGSGSFVGASVSTGIIRSLTNGPAANFYCASSDGINIGQTTAGLLFGGASAVGYRVSECGGTSTTLSTNDSYASHIIGTGLVTESTGTHAMACQLVVNPLTMTNGAGTTTDAATVYINGPMTGVTPTGRNDTLKVNGASYFIGKTSFDTTTTTVGTTGNQTINKPTGTVNIAAAGTTVTVTNSFCVAASIVLAVVRTNDTTARISNVVPAAGSFVINIVACTAEVSIGFLVLN